MAVGQAARAEPSRNRPSFEVLAVGIHRRGADQLRRELREHRCSEDMFTYEFVFVRSFEDALVATDLVGGLPD